MIYIPIIISYALFTVATVWDLRTRRIPNWLTVPAFVLGILFLPFNLPQNPFLTFAMVGIIAGLFIVRSVGTGDIKLLLALAVWNEGIFVLGSITIGALLLVIWHFIYDWQGSLRRIQSLWCYLQMKQAPVIEKEAKPMPFAPFLMGGYSVSLIIYIITMGGIR